jgi:hypothetical protein
MEINSRVFAIPLLVGVLALSVGCADPVEAPPTPTPRPATPTAIPAETPTPIPSPTAPPVATPEPPPAILPTFPPAAPPPPAQPAPGGVTVVPGDPSLSDPLNVTPIPTSIAGGALPQVPPEAAQLLAQAVADVAQRAGVGVTQVRLVEAEEVEWRDGSLGCPEPGMMYPQVITPGYRFVIEAGGQTYNYHTDRGSRVILCEQP